MNVSIRNAIAGDIENLIELNGKWQRDVISDLINGYVGAALSKATFTELIKRGQVVVAESEGHLAGYYLLNDFSNEGVIGEHKAIVDKLKEEKIVDFWLDVCVGGQAIVDKGFMGLGIRQQMLQMLVTNVKDKFDNLFGTIAKNNPRALRAHTRDGWIVVGENDERYYAIYKL